MKGFALAAHVVCAVLLSTTIHESLAKKSYKNEKKFPPPQHQGPGGHHRFAPPLPLPRFPPFSLPSVTQSPSTVDPYSCLPKYLCIIENKKGEKRTTILHGLHPALRKTKPDVIDPSTLPKAPGIPKPFISRPSISEASDDEMYRDREFSDSFLKQQEMSEAMAFLEEKRRQFLYQQGLPKQTIITKGGQKRPAPASVDEEEKSSKESNEDEEKSPEVEASKEVEVSKEEDISKEEKEENESAKSVEASKEEKEDDAEKSVELSKEEQEEEKDEPEEDSSVEEDASSEGLKSRSKLSKYKIKNKQNSKNKRKSSFKARMDDYEDVDSLEDHLATVPWDDRLRKNDTDPLKPSEIYDKLFRNVLPSFQLPSLPKIAKSIPGMSFLAKGAADEVTTTTTTTTPRPGIFKRMLNRVTGKGSSANSKSPSQPPPSVRRRNGRPVRRYKRAVSDKLRLISDDTALVKQIRDPEKQCRMIFKGCDLPYDHIMKMVSRGQVLIENDYEATTTPKPVANDPTFGQDDEADQAAKDKVAKKSPKPIPQLLAQASLGGKKKFGGGMPVKNNNKNNNNQNNKPSYDGSSEESYEQLPPQGPPFVQNPKKSIASLPLLPMKYQWGKPTYKVNGKPNGVSDFSGGITERITYKAPPTTTTTSTTPRPIFTAFKLDPRDNLTSPQLQHTVVKVNRTHAVHVLSKKPYNPPKTRTRDAKGQPMSFNSVFTEIAGNTGGIHDFFDRISGAFGGDGTESGRDFTSTFPGSNEDVHGNVELFPKNKPKKPVFPPLPPKHPLQQQQQQQKKPPKKEDGESDERDEEDSASEEGEEENKNENEEDQDEDEEADNDDVADDVPQEGQNSNSPSSSPQLKKKPTKSQTKPVKEEEEQDQNRQESEEEEDEHDDEGELDLPDSIPPFVRQSIIEEHKRKKQEQQAQKGGSSGGQPQSQDGRPWGRPHGRPGQQRPHPPPNGKPPRRGGGGFLSSLFS